MRWALVFVVCCGTPQRAEVTLAPQPLAPTASAPSIAATSASAPSATVSGEVPRAGLDVWVSGPAPGGNVIHTDDSFDSDVPMSRAVIHRIAWRSIDAIRACNPGRTTGLVMIRAAIEATGGVSRVDLEPATDLPSAVATCVAGVFRGLQFPQPQGGRFTLFYPVRFR